MTCWWFRKGRPTLGLGGRISSRARHCRGVSPVLDTAPPYFRVELFLHRPYTHLIGLKAAVRAVLKDSSKVTVDHVDAAVPDAVADVQESVRNMYTEATDGPRKGTLFKQVLLACALAKTDEEGFFRAKDIRGPLARIVGKDLGIPTFAQHLNDFSSDKRGPVLQKVGAPRRWRFRFINPLLEPYVVIKGLDEGLTSKEVLRDTEFSGFEEKEPA